MGETILFLGANPSTTTKLALEKEVDEIYQHLQAAPHGKTFHLQRARAVRAGEVQQSLLRYQPTIVHFSGHGSSAGELLLEDEHGHAVPVTPESLAKLFEIFSRDDACPRCVVLNACYSEAQASLPAARPSLR